ncbi:tyrosine-type recombinase/integrase [Amycolatopsis sp. WAC 04197]|uniref:tyrosine-type recombinase/integrase n=1 Tax=Amycolatopsis sp. WAC 04197 TaxID=2203199 RepID=UPI0013157E4D|nr:tyrosine-type recombinase/integrase [Amycolatopsis sp. WAC 04197]
MSEDVAGELVPAEAIPAQARDEAGERWQRELAIVRAWLKEVKGNTRSTYADAIGWPYDKNGTWRDTSRLRNGVTWLSWCARNGVHLLDVGRQHVVAWAEALNATPHPDTGQTLPHSTRAHTFTAASAFYKWAMQEGITVVNPMELINRSNLGVEMPKGTKSTTASLTREEVGALLAAADNDAVESLRLRNSAMVWFLFTVAPRVTEMTTLRVGKIRHTHGVRVVDLVLKGDRPHSVTLPPEAGERLDRYLSSRGIGSAVVLRGKASAPPYLFVTANDRPLARSAVNAVLERLARQAGIADPKRVTAHVARHTLKTEGNIQGYTDEQLQEHFGHRSKETTGRYGNKHFDPANSPGLAISAAYAEAAAEHRGSL